ALNGLRVQLFTAKPMGVDVQADADFNVRVAVKAGPHDLGVAFLKKSSSLLETERQPYQARINLMRSPRTQPALYSVSITGPFNQGGAQDTPSRKRIFVCQPSKRSEEDACAKSILTTLARRAYRRPVSAVDLQPLMKFYEDGGAGEGFDEGIETALRAILVNPEFLFRIEKDPANIPSNTTYR